jgi:hypothetical protein
MASWKRLTFDKPTTAYGLLKYVIELIEQEPARYNQGTWAELIRERYTPGEAKVKVHPRSGILPACGTIGCVAGWVGIVANLPVKRTFGDLDMHLQPKPGTAVEKLVQPRKIGRNESGLHNDDYPYAEAAAFVLGLSKEQADELFSAEAIERAYKSKWDISDDQEFYAGQLPTPGTIDYARLGVYHIQQFLNRYADQLKAKRINYSRVLTQDQLACGPIDIG